MILVLLWQEVLLFSKIGQLCAFTLTLIFLGFGQGFGQEPEGDTGQHDYGASYDEAQPPGPHPAGVLMVNGDGVWERGKTRDYEGGFCCRRPLTITIPAV